MTLILIVDTNKKNITLTRGGRRNSFLRGLNNFFNFKMIK